MLINRCSTVVTIGSLTRGRQRELVLVVATYVSAPHNPELSGSYVEQQFAVA